jgi:hypothetical protein
MLSIAVAVALSTVGGVARANPIPTSTDEARALYGQVTSKEQIDHTAQANAQVTSTDQARAEAGNTTPAPISRSLEALIARDEGEGRAASFAGDENAVEEPSMAVNQAGSATAEQGN